MAEEEKTMPQRFCDVMTSNLVSLTDTASVYEETCAMGDHDLGHGTLGTGV
jgi:hypothetical protein